MTISSIPVRTRWTVEDLDDLPRELRCELHDGVLEFRQPLKGWHRYVQYKLLSEFEETGVYADFEVGVINTPGDTRIADVAMFRGPRRDEDLELAHYPPERIRVVIEVVSASSAKKDRDPQWYADRGIEEYWLVGRVDDDAYDALITTHRLAVDGGEAA